MVVVVKNQEDVRNKISEHIQLSDRKTECKEQGEWTVKEIRSQMGWWDLGHMLNLKSKEKVDKVRFILASFVEKKLDEFFYSINKPDNSNKIYVPDIIVHLKLLKKELGLKGEK